MAKRSGSLPTEVFLSYSSRNGRFASTLADDLRRHKVRVWYSNRHILGAPQWHDEIGRALERCDWFLLLLSPSAVKSKWVKHELCFALNERRYENRIVPLIHRRCDFKKLSWTLQAYQMVDFCGNYVNACRELLRIWDVRYRP